MSKANPIYEQSVLIQSDSYYDQMKGNKYFVTAIEKLLKYRDLTALDKKEKITVLPVFSDINKIAGRYKWAATQLAPHRYHCQLCGTPIIYRYVLENVDTAKKVNVGCECVTRYPIRIDGYKSIEDLKRAVMERKEELSIIYKWQLWEASPERKLFEEANVGLANFSKILPKGITKSKSYYSASNIDSVKESAIQKALKETSEYPLLSKELSYYYSSNEIMKRIKGALDVELKTCKTFDFLVPSGKKSSKKFSFEFYREGLANFYVKEEVLKASGAGSIYELEKKISNLGWNLRNNKYISQIAYKNINVLGEVRKLVRFYKLNKKTINSYVEWLNDYANRTSKIVKAVFSAEEKKLDDTDKQEKALAEAEAQAELKKIQEKAKAQVSAFITITPAKSIDECPFPEVTPTNPIAKFETKPDGDSYTTITLGGNTEIKAETAKAILIKQGGTSAWLPLSQIKRVGSIIKIPNWLFPKTGLKVGA